MARRDLDAGLLEPVLLDWSLPEFGVFAVYPHRRFVSPKVRVLLEALMAHFGDGTRDPWWPEALSQAVAMPTAPCSREAAHNASMRANRQRDPRNAGSQSAPPAHSAQPVGKSRERRLCGAVRERPDLAAKSRPQARSVAAVRSQAGIVRPQHPGRRKPTRSSGTA